MKALLATTALILSVVSANAYDENYLSIGLGAHSAFDSQDKLAASVEWRGKRFDQSMIVVANISPVIGAMADTKGDLYGFGGILYDWSLNGPWHVIPSFAAGLYHHTRNGIDLGGTFELRYGAELSYMMNPQSTIGVGLYQMSNWGLYDNDPATEDVMVNYSFAY